jgi:hypothetical protein
MNEADLYKTLRVMTGDSTSNLRKMGFQHVEICPKKERPSSFAWKQTEKNPSQCRKEIEQ